ncbi:alpha/beta-hydrolase [Neocallimastix californiae]|jgi:para-nitrobenzyl esterase|uniref:Carboxylic ester hydrolase n=1 Tax=Neocallimastix californiae TaxID=1754190 RepID=A0A1Y2EQK2_9FUNG|nr:alpha/beta-hydrolase [Neocallimastix californiae]|eukprot:ORY73817.1 alpha/beta-hydrolase [Neocallimastix californiae]
MMQPENVTEISNLLTHSIKNEYDESQSEEEEEEKEFDELKVNTNLDSNDDDLNIKTMSIIKKKNKNKRTRICLAFLLVLLLAGMGVTFIFFSPRKFRINENTEDNDKSEYTFNFNENKIIEGKYNETLAIKCKNGIYVGQEENDNIISFKGIPYAKPPVGNLRWKPPVKPDDSENIYEAYYFGYSPIQTHWETEAASYYEQSENCLTLNIWMQKEPKIEKVDFFFSQKKPVMVFIHGGSYGWGGTVDPMYNGHNFVRNHSNIILVTINYRLGILGFIDFSKIKGGDNYRESGNLGILDQIQALHWIKENISEFGGDPDNITLFGESSGAGSTSILAVVPEAKGLFKRIIAQSGSIALTYSRKECEKLTKLLLKEANADTMDDLLTLNENTLKEINIKLNDYNNLPERDGITLPEDLYQAYKNGSSRDIDILIGSNKDESRYWIRAFGNEYLYQMAIPILFENNMKEVSSEDEKSAKKFVRLQETSYPWSISEFYNELLFRVPAIEQSIHHSKNGGNVYMYYWNSPVSYKDLGSYHSVELSYVMDNLESDNEAHKSGSSSSGKGKFLNKELATAVQDMWVNFAATGNPSIGNTTWEKFEPETKKTMLLGSNIEMKDHLLEEQYILIKPLLKYNFNGCYTDLNYNVNYVHKVIIGCFCIILAAIIFINFIVKRK